MLHPPPPLGGVLEYLRALYAWMLSLGEPLAVGLQLLAVTLAVVGYLSVRIAWRAHTVLAWRRANLVMVVIGTSFPPSSVEALARLVDGRAAGIAG